MGASDLMEKPRPPPSGNGKAQEPLGAFDEDIARLSEEWREKRNHFRSGRTSPDPGVPPRADPASQVPVSEALPPRPPTKDAAQAQPTDVRSLARAIYSGGRAEPPPPSDAGLAAAAAAGCPEDCRRILERDVPGPNVWGPDGTTPLCAAASWDHVDVLRLLLEAGADVRQRNRTAARPTPLHAAALQEHGKACMLLLNAGADPREVDGSGLTPSDYASCSEALWPLFAAAGCTRLTKEELINKGIIRKASERLERELEAIPSRGEAGLLAEFSRPGSAYVATARHPPRPGSALPPALGGPGGRPGSASAGSRPGSRRHSWSTPIDILAEGDEAEPSGAGGLRSLGL